jgi:hypothetical protein
MGLKDKIQKAKTSKKVEELLGEGKKYESASPKTVRKWGRAAQSRLNELGVAKTDKKSKKSRKKNK